MISINSLTVAFGSFTLLDDISFHISENDRVGLVGKNGAGKTTILRLICGLQSPAKGKVSVTSGLRIGYLPQIMEHHKGLSVIDETMTVFSETDSLEKELEKIAAQLAERTDYESDEYNGLIVRMNDINDLLNLNRAEAPLVRAERTLIGLGFKYNELNRPTETFSQGWNMRIELAKILLSKPDVLLLDEPTNHLDIESIEWLENYLKDFRGSMVLISHDRKFLDNLTKRTVEINCGHIHDYKVPYSKYIELRRERLEQQRAAYENQQRMIEKTEEFIEKFRYKPTKSNQVQSRVKALKKLERIEVDLDDRSALNVKFPPAPRAGDIVFLAKDLSVGYGPKTVFSHADIEVRRGEKIALVGRNGEGKTTLMRTIMGELQPRAGEAKLGYNVAIGYYAQNQEDVLDKNDTVFGTLDRIAVGDIRTRLRDILGAFLFKGEDIDKKVAVLSGGERARLAMAKLMLRPYNLLALDEPTNHMDIRSKDILKQALKAYDGTLVIVSHDRDFLDGLVDKLYEFRDGRVKEHLGGVREFLERRRIESLTELERRFGPGNPAGNAAASAGNGKSAPGNAKPTPGNAKPTPGNAAQPSGGGRTTAESASTSSGAKRDTKGDYRARKAASKEETKIKRRIEYLEKGIEDLEEKMKSIEKILENPTGKDDIMELTRSYLEYKRDLDAKSDEWGRLVDTVENT